jgi:hypothetical protein
MLSQREAEGSENGETKKFFALTHFSGNLHADCLPADVVITRMQID